MTLTALITEREGEFDEKFCYKDSRDGEYKLHAMNFAAVNYKDFLQESITAAYKLGLERAKGCVPEKDNTTDASEYERADRIAWNQCRDLTLKNLEEALAEQV